MNRKRAILCMVSALAIVGGACTGSDGTSSSPSSGGSHEPVTISVWDYYGKATPLQDTVIQRFQDRYPWITVDHQGIGWDAEHEKFTVAVSSGAAPDVATMDMTWMPTFASNGLFADLTQLSGGQLNGAPIEDQYSAGALGAMSYGDAYVTMMFDFDVYSLYYRRDVFEQKGIEIPTTWAEMQDAAKKLAEDTDSDGTCDKYCFLIWTDDAFHYTQPLLQNGGALLNDDNTAAAFNTPEGLAAMEYYKSFLDDGTGVAWNQGMGDPMAGIKDDRIGMFQDGPYWMGLLKSGAPEQKGDWAVVTAPYSTGPGSYLGGTGLSIPVNAAHPQEAWLFVQFMLQPDQQIGVFKYAGAAPATTAALRSRALTKPDPYFGDEAPFPVFMDAMATAMHFPYVAQWDAIDQAISHMVESVMLGKSTPEDALSDGAEQVDQELASG